MEIRVTVPTNIALLKYWGKEDAERQWPANDSLSMTMNGWSSVTLVKEYVGTDRFIFRGEKLGQDDPKFLKLKKHLDFLRTKLGFTQFLAINSHNTFPTACGLASSASGMAALTLGALCVWLEAADFATLAAKGYTRERIAHLSRLGSGSAGRSLWGGFVRWQKGADAESQVLEQVFDDKHWPLCNTVVMIDSEEKKTPSTDGHKLAWSSPLFLPRLAGMENKMNKILAALQQKSLPLLGPMIEQECLEMHAVMMSSQPPLFYFGEKTTRFLAWFRSMRERNHLQLYFTIDAGANVHIIGEKEDQIKFHEFLRNDYPSVEFIIDHVGSGPQIEELV